MGMFDKFKNMVAMPDEEEDEMEMDMEMEFAAKPIGRSSSREPLGEVDPSLTGTGAPRREPLKIPNNNMTDPSQLQVILVKPERHEDASTIADHLNEKKTVVLNLESTNKEVARRLFDFLSGVAYANGGRVERVANSTFLITPYTIDFKGDLLDELESNGMYL